MSVKKEFGDFQTPGTLASQVIDLVADLYPKPELVIEPTAGLGTFLKASQSRWRASACYEGYEINKAYVDKASAELAACGIDYFHRDFFSENWSNVLSRNAKPRVLVVGNPPWVTNSDLGQLGSQNLPPKTNAQGLKGMEARTGKSNFDISEWMLVRLIESLPETGALAMLCKTITARKVLRHFWKVDSGRSGASLFRIDAKETFDVAVDACLFFITGQRTENRTARVYSSLDPNSRSSRFGLVDGGLVSNIDDYLELKHLDGGSSYTWRSGLKHDASKVMELTKDGSLYTNGFGESFKLEDEFVYPLLKSSDLGNDRTTPRKHVLVTQQRTGDDTSTIKTIAPRTWKYLNKYAEILDGRKSSIYKKRPRFSIFGVGDYSFAPWKVAISGLYKSFAFVIVPPHEDRPVMIDDTCYSIPCETEEEAILLHELLSSPPAMKFIRSLVFTDSKRLITADVLRRLSLAAVAETLDMSSEFATFSNEDNAADSERLSGNGRATKPLMNNPA